MPWQDRSTLVRFLESENSAAAFLDDLLPQTGIALDWERALSPAFIRTPTYGTRASTLVRLGLEMVTVLEQGFSREGPQGRSEFQFQRQA